jgi:hypothetical protein
LLFALAWPQVHAPRPGYTTKWYEAAMTDAMALLYPAAFVVAASLNTMPFPLVLSVPIGSVLYLTRITGGLRVETSVEQVLVAAALTEPTFFHPTQLQRYGLWIATWLFVLNVPLLVLAAVVNPRVEGFTWALWLLPMGVGLLGYWMLTGPVLPTPKRLGQSSLKATAYWLLGSLCLVGFLLMPVLYAQRQHGFYSLLIVGGLMLDPYFKLCGWANVRSFWFRLPPREWPVNQDHGAKPGGAHAG